MSAPDRGTAVAPRGRMLDRILVVGVLSLAACGTDDPSEIPDDAFAEGPVVGTAPSGSRVAVIWVVNDGEDYAFKFGGGPVSEGRFAVSFDGEVPGDALTSEGWGHAFILLVDEDIPDLTRIEGELAFALLGVDVDHEMVFRRANATPSLSWVEDFPPGLSCGVCRRFEDGEQDELSPTTCNTVTMTVGDFEQLGGCNVD